MAYLDDRVQFGLKLGLETTHALLEALGRPEAHGPVLLVAGTNGKGSVAAYVASALQASGLRTGLYTSPHLVRVNERIAVDGQFIDDERLLRCVEDVRGAADALVHAGRMAAHPTYFETLTVAAFDHFRRTDVDVSVIEVGLGGRLDATNASEPLASAIVSISLDHEAYLGSTLDLIAHEKAGVLRRGRPTVTGPLPDEARDAILREGTRVGARVVPAFEGARILAQGAFVDIFTPLGTYRNLRPLPGEHQRTNLLVALRLLEEAAAAGVGVDWTALPEATAATRWPGRLQGIDGSPRLLLDGAHNAAGAESLAAHLRSAPPFVLLFGVMSDKGIEAMARELFPLAHEVVLTRPREGRAAAPDDIARRGASFCSRLHQTADVATGLDLARSLAGPEGLVVVAGSLYLVGEVLELVGEAPQGGPRPD